MEFQKYQHVERFGTDETNGIEIGNCYIFYKIDGTNGSLWLDTDSKLCAGSRNRTLSIENDNVGFYNAMLEDTRITDYFIQHPNHRLFGEWLVPHSLKTYRDDAWRRFYIFDVCIDRDEDVLEYIPYDIYMPMLKEFNLDYIPPIATITNPTYESLIKALEKTGQFLVKDGAGNGEGLVVKNYNYYNKYGRQTWAKIVTNEFKEKNAKEFGCPNIQASKLVEESITNDFCTNAFIEKEYSKLVVEKEGWQSRYIPELLGRIFYTLIQEECWNFVKQFKNPKIDFRILNSLVIQKVKECKKEIFM